MRTVGSEGFVLASAKWAIRTTDTNAPPRTAHELNAVIPGSIAHFLPDDGHLSIIASHGRDTLADFARAGNYLAPEGSAPPPEVGR